MVCLTRVEYKFGLAAMTLDIDTHECLCFFALGTKVASWAF